VSDTNTSLRKQFVEDLTLEQKAQLTFESLVESTNEGRNCDPHWLTSVFHAAFKFPRSQTLVLNPAVSDRERRLRLILEEFLELCGAMGFQLCIDGAPANSSFEDIGVTHIEGSDYCPVETADALADLNVVVNGTAIEFGIPIDMCNLEVFLSNMTKLGDDGKAILNGITEGYREGEAGYQSDAPIAKGLKGPNYVKPNLARVLYHHGF